MLCILRFGEGVTSPLEAMGGADLLLGFEPAETCRNLRLCNKDSSVVMNLDPLFPSMVAAGFETYPPVDDIVAAVRKVTPNLKTIDATSLAIEAGKAVAANAVMIGAVAAVKGFPLDRDILLEELKRNVPAKFVDINVKAFELGYARMSE